MSLSEKQPHLPVITILVSLNQLSLNWPPAAVFTGKYVMVMGVIQAVSPEPVVRAVKMADLSELAALHRRMWKLEVEDLQQVLAWIAEPWMETLPFLVAGRPAHVMRVQLGMQYLSDFWQMEKLPHGIDQHSLKITGSWLGGGMHEWQRRWHEKTVFTLMCDA